LQSPKQIEQASANPHGFAGTNRAGDTADKIGKCDAPASRHTGLAAVKILRFLGYIVVSPDR
jgi:hypothetical protein